MASRFSRVLIGVILFLVSMGCQGALVVSPTADLLEDNPANQITPSPTEVKSRETFSPPDKPPGKIKPIITFPPAEEPPVPIATPEEPALQDLLDKAIHDLAEKLNISPDEIMLVGIEEVVWPDSSLGCPQPGMMYLQVLTPGYRITLRVGDVLYTYHTDERTHVVYCKGGGVMQIPPLPVTPGGYQPWSPVVVTP